MDIKLIPIYDHCTITAMRIPAFKLLNWLPSIESYGERTPKQLWTLDSTNINTAVIPVFISASGKAISFGTTREFWEPPTVLFCAKLFNSDACFQAGINDDGHQKEEQLNDCGFHLILYSLASSCANNDIDINIDIYSDIFKNLTKYDQFSKRDESFAKAVKTSKGVVYGKETNLIVLKWYRSLFHP